MSEIKSKQVESTGNVRVVCRFRPINQKEFQMDDSVCCEFLDSQTVTIKSKEHESSPDKIKYFFDRVYPMNTTQEEIYSFAAKPVIESVLEGFNGTVFAYGQTSSGKTFTMQGPNIEDPQLKGIIPRMVTTVFDAISNAPDHIEFRMKISLVEIYMERIRDLLDISKTDLKIREDKSRGIYIQDVTETYVSEEIEVYNLMRIGNSNRAISATQMNEGSSRSHSIFMLTISQNNLNDLSAKKGKLFLVDLAGSEKVGKTGASGQTLDEAKKINKSLSSLGNVINSLTDGKSTHIPYRDSRLTRILQESLGGNARTTLIITCSPSPYNEAETISTLRFGVRAKSIKNKPKINRELTVAELQNLLAKAEKTIEEKVLRIKNLEEYIKKIGNTVPEEDNIILEKLEEEDSELIESGKIESEGIKKKEELLEIGLEKIKNLETELEIERNNVKSQTEKLNSLKKEFALINTKSITQEKENEILIHKISEMTVLINTNEEGNKDKDDKIDQLENLKETYLNEIENLKESKEHLLQIIEQKNREIESLEENSQNFKLTHLVSQIINANYDENNVKNLVENYQKNINVAAINSNSNLENNNYIVEELQKKINELEKSQITEKDLSKKYFNDFQELKSNYENLIKEKYPDQEFIQRLWNHEEISKKNSEIFSSLEKEKEKSKFFENYLIQIKKALKKKINILESNLETLTMTTHQLISQRSVLKVDNQALEKKLIRKNEKIMELEKKYSESQEQQKILKSKYESAKIMINQAELGSHVYAGAFEVSSPLSKRYQEKIEKLENENFISLNKIGSGHNKKIVKHIRGGQGKKSSGSFANILN